MRNNFYLNNLNIFISCHILNHTIYVNKYVDYYIKIDDKDIYNVTKDLYSAVFNRIIIIINVFKAADINIMLISEDHDWSNDAENQL